MTPHADHPPPPHIELLDAPAVRFFDHALADVRERWKVEVARQRGERVVFTDQRVSTSATA